MSANACVRLPTGTDRYTIGFRLVGVCACQWPRYRGVCSSDGETTDYLMPTGMWPIDDSDMMWDFRFKTLAPDLGSITAKAHIAWQI